MSLFLTLQELSFVIQETLNSFESASLFNSEGQILGMKYESLPDIGTFSPFVQTARQYFPMAEGDAVLTNDPFSGGTTLNVLSVVISIPIEDQVLFLAARTHLPQRLVNAQKLEEEGLRIPPTPIASKRKINEAILSAMASHPQAPSALSETLQRLLEKLWRQADLLKMTAKKNPSLFLKPHQKALLQETKHRIQGKLADLPHGDQRLDLPFGTGELIRLHTELKTDGVHFDFAGTSGSKRLFLTDQVTFGTCMGAFLSFLAEDFLLNEGVFNILNVTTPQGCFLNAKYPSPVFEGVTEASSVLASAVVQSLSLIASAKSLSFAGTSPTIVNFEFGNGNAYFDFVPGGSGGTAETSGLDGFHFWSLRQPQISIEQIEERFPLRILQSGVRQNSGGKGKSNGGNGVLREIEVLGSCSLNWLLGGRNVPLKISKGLSNGAPAEIQIIRANGEKLTLSDCRGSIQLDKGDKVITASAGGTGIPT